MKMEKVISTSYRDRITGEEYAYECTREYSVKVKNEEQFYITYINTMSYFYKLRGDNPKNLLIWLCCHAEYNTGIIYLNPDVRNQICNELHISKSVLSMTLKKLKELNLIHDQNSTYSINPTIFWRGDKKSRDKILGDSEIRLSWELIPKEEDGEEE